jgi:hypothetical protein
MPPDRIDWFFKHPPLVFMFFGALAALSSYVSAVVSGWSALSKRFQFTGQFHGQSWPLRIARMRFFARYWLTVGAEESGLYLSVFSLFRIAHPPLLIPWSEVTVMPGYIDLIFKKRELRLGRQESIPLRISASLFERLRSSAGGAWPQESVMA